MTIKTILVEDSKKIQQEMIPSMAELSDAEVIAVAESADEAETILKIHSDSWQLAVVDLFLKGGSSGLTVLRLCRGRYPWQKVIVLSNYATQDLRRTCSDLGADAVFDKSTELEAFFDYCVAVFASR